MMRLRFGRQGAVRGGMAGAEAVAARSAALALFEAGGRRVLPETMQRVVRGAVEHEASRWLVGVGLLEGAPSTAMPAIEGATMRTLASQAARAAGRQVLRSVGAAAGAGAILDGGWALVRSVDRIRRGLMTRRQAAEYVAREATTGAAAAAAGTAAGVAMVVLTGGIGAPAVFMVGAAASLATKAGLDAWLGSRGRGAIEARLEPQAT